MSDPAISRSPATISAGVRIATGASLGDPFPTMASVNADYTHFNQAIALYNRRTNQIMATPDPSVYLPSSVTDGNLVSAALITDLRTKINTMRTLTFNSAYVWTHASVSADQKISQADINDLFAALAFIVRIPQINAGNVTVGHGSFPSCWVASFQQSPYGTNLPGYPFVVNSPGVECIPSGSTGLVLYPGVMELGQQGTSGTSFRIRTGMSYDLTSLTGLASASAIFTANVNAPPAGSCGGTIGPGTIDFWASNTDDSAGTGTWYNNLNTSLGTFPAGTGNQSIAIPWSVVSGRAGSKLSIVVSTYNEMINNPIDDWAYALLVQQPLILDYGF